MSLKFVALFALFVAIRAQNPATNLLGAANLTAIRTPISQIVKNLTEILQIIEKMFATGGVGIPDNASAAIQYVYRTVYELLMEMTYIQMEIGGGVGSPVIGK